eukprot:534347-Pelagomonas_calceolata.AAC.1
MTLPSSAAFRPTLCSNPARLHTSSASHDPAIKRCFQIDLVPTWAAAQAPPTCSARWPAPNLL